MHSNSRRSSNSRSSSNGSSNRRHSSHSCHSHSNRNALVLAGLRNNSSSNTNRLRVDEGIRSKRTERLVRLVRLLRLVLGLPSTARL